VNVADRRVVADIQVGESLVDLAWAANGQVIAIDQDLGQLISFSMPDGNPRISKRIALDLDPRRVAVSDDFRLACVSGRWSKSVQVVVWTERNKLIRRRPIQLGFEAEEILPLPDHQFLVADAFAGQLAVIDATGNRVTVTRQLHGHNIRGLAMTVDGSSVLISHQTLSRVARSDFDDIHWGSLMQNVVSRVPLEALLDPSDDLGVSMQRIQLGDVGNGFADPTGVLAISEGFAALSGGGRQLIIYQRGQITRRVQTGSRPKRILQLGEGRVVALNEHDASLTFSSLIDATQPVTIKITPEQAVSDGEQAFFDASLSHDSWMTCNSCHVEGHSADLTADTLGDGVFGNPKRIPSLLGAKQTQPYGWLGDKPDLSLQISATLASTMHGESIGQKLTDDLVQFVQRLAPPPVARKTDAILIEAGQQIFKRLKCNECHLPPEFTSPITRDVGLEDEIGNRKFNPPSLRGLSHRRAFFHDARAKSLRSVFREYQHQLPNKPTDPELEQLLAYLSTL
jgi:hypothetical protein